MKNFLLFRSTVFPFLLLFCFIACSTAQNPSEVKVQRQDSNGLAQSFRLTVGAERTELYFPELLGKRVGLVANHSSRIKKHHLLDSLLSAKINVVKIFTPEHGFRGEADAGENVSDGIDLKTGTPIVSLYGNNKKPADVQMQNIDIMVFDIQDVGARFYTYISTLHYIMEACAEHQILLIVLDRPNPNGFYVDGPILEKKYHSFVGIHPVPVVHGMTIGEYAQMINGESWLKNGAKCELEVVKNLNYDHLFKYQLHVKPSPNLPNMLSVYLYPSLCFFEGTAISVGRGTEFPFQQIGHPSLKGFPHLFIPRPMLGASDPKLNGQKCFGYFFGKDTVENWLEKPELELDWLLEFYHAYDHKKEFFNNYFNTLAGNSSLKSDIIAGKSAEEIRASWQKDLTSFKVTRKKYLLYPDFE